MGWQVASLPGSQLKEHVIEKILRVPAQIPTCSLAQTIHAAFQGIAVKQPELRTRCGESRPHQTKPLNFRSRLDPYRDGFRKAGQQGQGEEAGRQHVSPQCRVTRHTISAPASVTLGQVTGSTPATCHVLSEWHSVLMPPTGLRFSEPGSRPGFIWYSLQTNPIHSWTFSTHQWAQDSADFSRPVVLRPLRF
jgi:hypothetical protein